MKKATSPQSRLQNHPASLKLCKVLTTFDNTLARNGFYSLPLAQVFKSRHSVTQARKPWFFCTLKPIFDIGRGGISSIQKRFTVKTYAPFYGGFEHPDCLQKQLIQKTIGGIHHA